MDRIRVAWDTQAGGPGLATFYAVDAETATVRSNLVTFFNAIKTYMPTGTSVTIPNSGDTLDPATGALSGTWTAGSPSTVTGTASVAPYAAGTGTYVKWLTAGIRHGRRVQGRTFLAPLSIGVYGNNGTIDDAVRGVIQTAANALSGDASGSFVVWSRPGPSGTDGAINAVIGASVSDTVSSLSSRRR